MSSVLVLGGSGQVGGMLAVICNHPANANEARPLPQGFPTGLS
jgi:hypothetical protein